MSNKQIGVILLFLGLVFLLLGLYSCKTVKDNHAYKRVISDDKLFDSVGKKWEKQNPSDCKDSIQYIKGKIDSIPFPVPVIDTAKYTKIKDSLLKTVKVNLADCDRQVYEAYNVGYKQARYELSKQKIADKNPDTVRIKSEDTRRINLLRQDISFRDGKITQLEVDNKAEKKRGDKYFWLFIGSVTLSVLVTAWKIYRKIKIVK